MAASILPKDSNFVWFTQVEKKVNEETKTVEQEGVPQSKENGGIGEEEKPQQQSQVTEEVDKKSKELEPKESVDGEIATNEGTSADKVGESLKEEQTSKNQECVASGSLGKVVSTNQEVHIVPKEDAGDSSLPAIVKEASLEDGKKKECGADVEEGLLKEVASEVGKVEEVREEKKLKIEEEGEEKKAKIDEPTQPKTDNIEDISGSGSAKEVTEKSFEGEKASRDVEVVTEEKKEDIKDSDVERKGDDVNSTTTTTITFVNEPTGEPKKSELEAKAEETVQARGDQLEKAKEVEEIVKSDVTSLESSKDSDDSKTSGDPSKQEIPAKPTQKQSNNFILKVKHSIVKVKKAIIRKSPNSKALSFEAKKDIEV
ncbi:hypothetical protein HHK36_026241 [Tetracentron sinense]|uniref:Uncharacterized protein n=1 Tax=Tetracentron sinense TaxID=13715 RepID=A0A835D220_TETSI|nr:hypothetical protein HHK36_026241 [Tetracentron sinense]